MLSLKPLRGGWLKNTLWTATNTLITVMKPEIEQTLRQAFCFCLSDPAFCSIPDYSDKITAVLIEKIMAREFFDQDRRSML